MLQDSRQAGPHSQLVEAAAAEAAAFLSINVGDAISLRDYLASVEIFASALGWSLPHELEVRR